MANDLTPHAEPLPDGLSPIKQAIAVLVNAQDTLDQLALWLDTAEKAGADRTENEITGKLLIVSTIVAQQLMDMSGAGYTIGPKTKHIFNKMGVTPHPDRHDRNEVI